MSDAAFKEKCVLCKNEKAILSFDCFERQGLECPICGRYIFPPSSTYLISQSLKSNNFKSYDVQHLISYLYHNKLIDRSAFVGTEAAFEEYKKDNSQSTAFLVSPEIVENWYPKNVKERIDYILLTLAKQSRFIGDEVRIEIDEVNPLFFLTIKVISEDWENEVKFIIRYLGNEELIEEPVPSDKWREFLLNIISERCLRVALSAKAWGIVYDLQKNQTNNKKAFVAMKFGYNTRDLRERIKKGILLAGYEPRIMDEIEHNHQIVPEMLYEIKNSRFVIAELSHHNNGAYYEAGYANGLGKEVIHICSEEALKNELHFDVVQINTVVYKSFEEILEKLKNRIKATII